MQQCSSDWVMTDSWAACRCVDASEALCCVPFSRHEKLQTHRASVACWRNHEPFFIVVKWMNEKCPNDNWVNQAVRELFIFFFNNQQRKLGNFILSQKAPPAALLSINCLIMWSVFRGYRERLLHFDNHRLCQWQLLGLFWNSGLGVSWVHIDSKCDSSCHCGILVLMIGQLIEWGVSSWKLWAKYQVAGPLLIGATFDVKWNKQVMRIIQLTFRPPKRALSHVCVWPFVNFCPFSLEVGWFLISSLPKTCSC